MFFIIYLNPCTEIDVKSFKCVYILTKNLFYKDVLQANNLWKWNHFLAKLCNLTLELCHFSHVSPTMYRNWQQEFQIFVSWLKHLYRDVLEASNV